MSDLSASLLSMPPFGGPDPWTSPMSRTDWSGVAATRAAMSGPEEADETDESGADSGDADADDDAVSAAAEKRRTQSSRDPS